MGRLCRAGKLKSLQPDRAGSQPAVYEWNKDWKGPEPETEPPDPIEIKEDKSSRQLAEQLGIPEEAPF